MAYICGEGRVRTPSSAGVRDLTAETRGPGHTQFLPLMSCGLEQNGLPVCTPRTEKPTSQGCVQAELAPCKDRSGRAGCWIICRGHRETKPPAQGPRAAGVQPGLLSLSPQAVTHGMHS